jgi:general L-amino acid transport system permease protein
MTAPQKIQSKFDWLRKNLFYSFPSSLLTIISAYLLWTIVSKAIQWAILDANFVGSSREDCQLSGACWVFISTHLEQFIYGFYQQSERWRVNASFFLLVTTLLTWIFAHVSLKHPLSKKIFSLWTFLVFPLFTWNLLKGPALGLPLVETSQWGGVFLTLVISVVGIVCSFPIGILLALGRRSKLSVIRTLSVLFIELWRGVPLITVLFMSSVMLPLFFPEGMNFDKLLRALIGVVLFSSAYMAEVVRGGLQAIPKGQIEAAKALGLSSWKTMLLIVLPQALKHVIPGVVNNFIGLFKDTTLVAVIGLFDILGIVQTAATVPAWLGFSVEGYGFAAVFFWSCCFSMSKYSQSLEQRFRTTH